MDLQFRARLAYGDSVAVAGIGACTGVDKIVTRLPSWAPTGGAGIGL